MITVVMLGWARPENTCLIIKQLQKTECVDEILLWNNNAKVRYPFEDESKVRVVTCSENAGLLPRYALSLLAKNPCVMIQDDDLQLPAATIERLYAEWRKDPTRIHGLYGRLPKKDGTYADFRDRDECRVPIVLGRVMMFSRILVSKCFFKIIHTSPIERLFERGRSRNCLASSVDDIVFSYSVSQNNILHYIWPFPRIELSTGSESIHASPGHMAYRNDAMITCQRYFCRG